MQIIDAHCHAAPFYYEPIESALDSLLRNGVEKALLIPLAIVESLNPYLIECLQRFPGRFSMVATVDPLLPDAPEQLEEWARRGAEGVRLSPGDPMSIWRKAAELGLVVSLRRRVEDSVSDDFRNIVESLPDLKIVIEHLGCRREDAVPPYDMTCSPTSPGPGPIPQRLHEGPRPWRNLPAARAFPAACGPI